MTTQFLVQLIVFVTGPTGAGKNDIRKGVADTLRSAGFSVVLFRTSTSRPRDPEESTEDDQYERFEHGEFVKRAKAGEFAETNQFAQSLYGYGVRKEPLLEVFRKAEVVIIEMNYGGMQKLKPWIREQGIEIPMLESLIVPGRKTDPVDRLIETLRRRSLTDRRVRQDLDKRMAEARIEFARMDEFSIVVENPDGAVVDAIAFLTARVIETWSKLPEPSVAEHATC